MTLPLLSPRPTRGLLGALALCLGLASAAWTPAAAQVQQVPQSRQQIQLSFAPVVKQAAPAVVNIYTKKVVRTVSPIFNDPFFGQFFGQQMGIPQERVERSLGSGVIVRPDGVIVTNNHVVQGADQVTVVLSDRREFEAKVLGTDARTDLAVLKIDAGPGTLPVLPFGDADSLEVGDLVLAIGDPFGVGQTVTQGIVSALARTIGIGDYRSFIQTDAAINPGNSGGALIDLQGRLVGINSAIYSAHGGGSVGIGFAIPVSMVKTVLANITTHGKALRSWLGATGQAVTADMYQALQLPRPYGVLLNGVAKGSPAADAGLRVGDIITAVDGHETDDPEALRFRIATLPVGATAHLTVIRNGQTETIETKLTAPPDTPARDATEIKGRNPFSGTVVANMNPALAEELGLESYDPGVTIVKLVRGSIANRLQFQPGDIILKVNGRAVPTVEALKPVLAAGAQSWSLTIRRAGQVMSMTIGG